MLRLVFTCRSTWAFCNFILYYFKENQSAKHPSSINVWEKCTHNLKLMKKDKYYDMYIYLHVYAGTCIRMYTPLYTFRGTECFHYADAIPISLLWKFSPLQPPHWSYMPLGFIFVSLLVGVFKTLCRGISIPSKVTRNRWYKNWAMKLKKYIYLRHAFYLTCKNIMADTKLNN